MFQLTVAESVLLLGIPGILVSLYLGLRQGERDKQKSPPNEPISALNASILDAATARELVNVLRDLALAIREGITAENQRAQDAIEAKLDRALKHLEAKERGLG